MQCDYRPAAVRLRLRQIQIWCKTGDGAEDRQLWQECTVLYCRCSDDAMGSRKFMEGVLDIFLTQPPGWLNSKEKAKHLQAAE